MWLRSVQWPAGNLAGHQRGQPVLSPPFKTATAITAAAVAAQLCKKACRTETRTFICSTA